MTKILIAVFLGGGTGSLLRYCVQMAPHKRTVPHSFPWATFAVNITGSLLIGLFCALFARFSLSAEVRILLTTRLCSGFTTFSTFSDDRLILMKQGFYGLFVTCTLLNTLLGISATLGGNTTGRTL